MNTFRQTTQTQSSNTSNLLHPVFYLCTSVCIDPDLLEYSYHEGLLPEQAASYYML